MNTTSLHAVRDSVAITYLEADNELRFAYDVGLYTDSIVDGVGTHDVGEEGIGQTEFENPLTGSLRMVWWDAYLRHNVYKEIGETFDRFLARPRWELTEILKRLKSRENMQAQVVRKMQQDMDDLSKGQ